MCDQQSLRSACAYMQSDQSLCLSLEYPMRVKLLTEHHLRFLSLKGGCTGWSESTPVKMPHCWKLRVTAHFVTNMLSSWARTQVSDRYFPRPGYWPNIGSFPIKKNQQKLLKMVNNISNFLAQHFGEHLLKIRPKIPKFEMISYTFFSNYECNQCNML